LTAYTLLTKHPQSIAVKSLQLFLGQIQNAPEQLKFKLLQIVFDLMVMYDQQLWGRAEDVSRATSPLHRARG
jgi:condensin complex subunit 3